MNVIDPSPAIARQTGRVLAERGLSAPDLRLGQHAFYTSGERGAFSRVLDRLVNPGGQIEVAAWRNGRTVFERS